MVVGFNHNFRYRGEVFHVQTEDGGRKNPQIVTLLYRGGTILASKKTSYADLDKVNNLDRVVEELMKEQHKDMLRRLKNGEFDSRIEASLAKVPAPAREKTPPPPVDQPAPAEADAAGPAAGPRPSAEPPPARQTPSRPVAAGPAPAKAEPAKEKAAEKAPEMSLDDIILSYLVGEDHK
ncbi:hypothetical protein DESUT3_08680 [Desulfuromonas versatilis]|uniref:Uncharacterized protein n=1 Tax=Desulfuromonas versatilis TaxID=2802975 RepID=A0ABM8HPY1_9BACT|nr:hypothetical protein [Desulfuromonas versatilis]BCR03799.1 hypothetical protein DESUT3_08680 [Desulfuromonas versatilis]